MSGESWLAFKDSLTHQSWFSRLGFLFFPGGVCFITVLFIFPFSKQNSLIFCVYDLRCDWGPEAGGAGGCLVEATFTFLIFYKLLPAGRA